jgi:lysophospholipase L1-like esterase
MIIRRKKAAMHEISQMQVRLYMLCTLLLAPFLLYPSVCAAVCTMAESVDIVAFGDSLTQGCYLSYEGSCGKEPDGQGSPYSYPLSLQTFLRDRGINAVVRNFGKGGEKTDEGVGRFSTVMANACTSEASYVLILEGTNDLLASGYADLDTILFNLRAMADKALQYGKQPMLATIPPDLENDFKRIEEMNEKIRQLTRDRQDIILVDLYNALKDNWYNCIYPQGCYQDETHPNFWGFEAMAGVWYYPIMAQPEFNPTPCISGPNLLLLGPGDESGDAEPKTP